MISRTATAAGGGAPSAIGAPSSSSSSSSSSSASTAALRRPLILERSLNKTRGSEVGVGAFSFLFSEMVQYSQKRVASVSDLERKLSDFGYRVGIRELELTVWRDKGAKRETRVLGILYFINTTLWKSLFGKQADSLQKSTDNEDEYMITDNDPVLSKYVSTPGDLSGLNTGAFVAGIVEAVLDGSHFPSKVSAHSNAIDGFPSRTTILIKFDKSVIQREKKLEGGK